MRRIFLFLLFTPFIITAQKPQLVIQSGFQSEITYGAVSPDKKLVLTIDDKATMLLWELRTGRQLLTFKNIVWAVFGIDGKSIEINNAALELKTIDFNGKTIPNSKVRNSTFPKNGNIIFKTDRADKYERTWFSPEDQKTIKDKDENTYSYSASSYVANLKYNASNNFITRYKAGNAIQLYNASNGTEVKSLNFSAIDLTILNSSEIKFTQFSGNGNYLVAGNKYTLEVLDVNNGNSIFKFKYLINNSELHQINMANFSPDNKRLLIVTTDDVRLIDLATGKLIWKTNLSVGVQEFSAKRAAVSFSIDGSIALVGDNRVFYCINTNDGTEISKLSGVAQKEISQILLRNNSLLVVQEDTIMKWDLLFGALQKTTPVNKPRGYISANANADKFYFNAKELDEKSLKVTVLEMPGIPQNTPGPPRLSVDDKFAVSVVDLRVRDEVTREESIVPNLVVNNVSSKKIAWKKSKIGVVGVANKSFVIAASPYFPETQTSNEIYLLDSRTGSTIKTINLETPYHYIRDFTFSPNDSYLTFDTELGSYLIEMSTFKVDKVNVKAGTFGNAKTFSANEKVLFIKGDDKIVQYYDISQRQLIADNASKETFNMVSIFEKTNNGRFYFTNDFNTGLVNLWDINKKSIVATVYSFPSTGDWAVITPDGRFDGTRGAMANMYFVKEINTFPLEVLYEKFYTPRLLTRILNGEEFPPVETDFVELHKAPVTKISYQEKVRNLVVDDDERADYTNTTGVAALTIEAVADNDKVAEIRLFHNGKIVSLATRGLFVTDEAAGTDSKKVTINLLPGKNVFRAVALNTQRTESQPDQIIVNYVTGANNAPVVVKPVDNSAIVSSVSKDATLHLIVVGINEYQNKTMSLNYAMADATSFKEELEKDARSVIANIKTYFVSNNTADKTGITNAFKQVQQTSKAQDVFIFYYAGHGVIAKDKEFYLVPTDVSDLKNVQTELEQKGISSKLLQQYAIDIQAQKQLFVLDACQSAGAFETMLSNDGNQQKTLAVVARSTGTHWMAASGAQQFANEFSQLGHGAFTYVLLQALKGQAANNKMITVNGLKNYLQTNVPELMKKYNGTTQYPASFGFGSDFPVEIIK